MGEDRAEATATSCRACGAAVAASTRFCTTCGVDLTTVDPQPTVELRPCRSCGAANHPERELCWSCGVDLASGVRPPALADRAGAAWSGGPSQSAPASIGARRWWIPVGAVLGSVAVILLGLWFAELGPFAPPPDRLPAVEFPAERYPGEPGDIGISDVATTTFRAAGGSRSYLPQHLGDQDPTTAWHADSSQLPEGVEETVDLYLVAPAWVSGIIVGNGDQFDSEAYAAAGRVQRARILLDGDSAYETVLLDLGREPQVVELPEPVLTTTVRLELVDVLAGEEWPYAAVSRLGLLGWEADAEDAALAQRRGEQAPAAGVITLVIPGR